MRKTKEKMEITQQSPENQKKVNDAINSIVAAMLEKDARDSYITDTKDRIETDIGMSKGQLMGYVKLRYMQETNPEKYEKDKDWFDSCFEENEILSNF